MFKRSNGLRIFCKLTKNPLSSSATTVIFSTVRQKELSKSKTAERLPTKEIIRNFSSSVKNAASSSGANTKISAPLSPKPKNSSAAISKGKKRNRQNRDAQCCKNLSALKRSHQTRQAEISI